MRTVSSCLLVLLATSGLLGCAQGHRPAGGCVTSVDCAVGRCVDGVCIGDGSDAGTIVRRDGGHDDDGGTMTVDAGPPPMCTTSAGCDDSDMCTTDACMGGTCTSTPTPCDDGDRCTDDSCDPATGCATTPTSCDDSDACTADGCDSVTGCSHMGIVVPGGSCASPIDVSAGGTFTGDSTCAPSSFTGLCMSGGGPDIAFVLTLAAESDVTLDARATSFSAVLIIGAACGTAASVCDSDGTPSIATRLPAGRHYIGLDGGASSAAGAYSLTVTITPAISDELLSFPVASDAHVSASGGGYYWNSGDSIQGVRSTGLASITSADLSLRISPNGLTCDTQDMRLRINGTVVGSVIIAPGATTLTTSYTFGAITGPSYTLRLETTRTVASGCGAAGFPDGVSTLRIRR